MTTFIKLQIIILGFLSLLFFVSPTFAAAPDGAGPWADSVFSVSQGLMKNGLAVPSIRSDPTSALGVAENDTVDGHFYSLGFGGSITLGFDNGISSGSMIVEATNPGYPDESAKVEMSEDGVNWVMAGNVTQDGTVNKPDGITCAKYVRITDISDASIFPDDIADGYDVDGVQATGDPCSPTTPTPTSSPTTSSSGGSTSTSTSNTTSSNTVSPCTSSGVASIPNIILARRLNPTSIFVNWGPNAGLNDFIVQYGFQNGNWQFNTKVSGFSTTINDLPTNQSIWIEVAATDNCKVGSYGTAVLVGGTALTNSPGFPNTGNPLIPGLPNTGINPNQDILSGAIAACIHFILSFFSKA